jgi:hypothetical protein
MHRYFRWATRTENAAGLRVRDVGTFDLFERNSVDEVESFINVCEDG